MATTHEILAAARELGKLIATHDAARRFEEVARQLQADTEAQRALNDFNRFMQKIAEKEAAGQPIEVADKRQLEALQNKVVRMGVLQKFQIAQMDYLDLMRQVDDAINAVEPPPLASAAAGPGLPSRGL